jgi:hypothetical protein
MSIAQTVQNGMQRLRNGNFFSRNPLLPTAAAPAPSTAQEAARVAQQKVAAVREKMMIVRNNYVYRPILNPDLSRLTREFHDITILLLFKFEIY